MATTKKTGTATTATDTIENAFSEVQDRFLEAMEQSQSLALEGYRTVLDGMAKLDVPSIPGLADMYRVRNDLFEKAFDFGIAVLESQRTFTRNVLETAADAQK